MCSLRNSWDAISAFDNPRATSPRAQDSRLLHRLGSVARLPHHLDVGLGIEDPAEPGADEALVVDEEDARQSRRSQGQAGAELEASLGSPAGVDLAAVDGDALADSSESVSGACAVPVALAVVEDLELEVVGRVAQHDVGPPRAHVLQGVRQRLLHDPIRGDVDARRELSRLAFDCHLHGQAAGG